MKVPGIPRVHPDPDLEHSFHLSEYQFESESEAAQSCPTLCDPMDCSLSGSSVNGIFQARVLEWIAFPSPGDLPDPGIEPGSPALQADTLPSEPPEKPQYQFVHPQNGDNS